MKYKKLFIILWIFIILDIISTYIGLSLYGDVLKETNFIVAPILNYFGLTIGLILATTILLIFSVVLYIGLDLLHKEYPKHNYNFIFYILIGHRVLIVISNSLFIIKESIF